MKFFRKVATFVTTKKSFFLTVLGAVIMAIHLGVWVAMVGVDAPIDELGFLFPGLVASLGIIGAALRIDDF